MDVVIAKPIKTFNIKYYDNPSLIEVIFINPEDNIKYVKNISNDNIPLKNITIYNFYKLLTDIIINKKDNSNFRYKIEKEKCILICNINLNDYQTYTLSFTLELNKLEIFNLSTLPVKKE